MNERPHKRLDAWQLAMELCKDVYDFCEKLPKNEQYGLSSQMKRAAVSIPSNIAEGAARSTKKEFSHFLSISQGSLSELDTQLELCCILEFTTRNIAHPILKKIQRISMMITALKKSLKV